MKTTFMQLALEGSNDGCWHCDAITGITQFNARWAEMLGYRLDEIKPHIRSWRKLIHPDDRVATVKAFNAHFSGHSQRFEMEHRLQTKDGKWRWFLARGKIVCDPFLMAGTLIDITDRKLAELQILDHQRQLRSLTSQLALAEERERRRIADNLHDSVGQILGVCKMKLSSHQESASSCPQVASLKEIRRLIDEAIRDVRALTFDLSPPVLYEMGLGEAAEWLAEKMGRQFDLQIQVEHDHESMPMSDDVRAILFRSMRELLTNAAKHARARQASVSIRRDDDHIRIIVTDDGIGFNVADAERRTNETGGYGIFSIREGMRHLGGAFVLESEPGRGTRAILSAPLKQAATTRSLL